MLGNKTVLSSSSFGEKENHCPNPNIFINFENLITKSKIQYTVDTQ